MSRRLYLMLPDAQRCKALVEELEQQGVPERHLHVIGSLTKSLEGLPEAGVMQKTELISGLKWGTGLGGMAGFLGGVLTVTFPPPGVEVGETALLVGAVAGAAFGAVVASLLSIHQHNHKLDEFERGIERGKLLLMVDVPRRQVAGIKELILRHHPEATIGVVNLG